MIERTCDTCKYGNERISHEVCSQCVETLDLSFYEMEPIFSREYTAKSFDALRPHWKTIRLEIHSCDESKIIEALESIGIKTRRIFYTG